VKVALIGYGNVGKAFAKLLHSRRSTYPFRIVGIHTARHGTAYGMKGLGLNPEFDLPASTISRFLEAARPDVAIEITTLNPETGEPAIGHIKTAIGMGIHVITANKGPIAHAYAELRELARRAQVEFRFESTVMDGAPVFNMVRNCLPGIQILGFKGCLNSTSKLVIEAMGRGLTLEEGVKEAQAQGVAEADASFDIDGWDSAAKTAALANVFMDARANPGLVEREGIRSFTTRQIVDLTREGKTAVLMSRGERDGDKIRLIVRPEVLPVTDLLATAKGTSNVLLLHTDLMGTVGTVAIRPGVEQTAYGLFSDLVDIAKSV
jgi:homoserine dehydrogenase